MSESSFNQIIFIFLEIQSKWNHRVDNGDECEAAPLCERVNSFQTRADSDLASVIVPRAGVRDDERLFVPLRSQFIAHLCQAPLFQVCGGKVTARSQSFTTKQKQLRRTFPSATNDPDFSAFKRNKPSCWLFPQTRTSRTTWRICYRAGYHVKKGSYSSKHPLFLWSADTIGVWRALISAWRTPAGLRLRQSFLQRATVCTFTSWINQADKD